MIPKWLKKHLKEDDITEINQSINKAEEITQAEIVPVIVKTSSKDSQWFLILLLLIIAKSFYEPWYTIIALLLFFYINLTKDRNVFKRAMEEFKILKIDETEGKTGVLIYVSMYERQVVILADKEIDTFLKESELNDIISRMLNKIKEKEFKESIILGINDLANSCKDIHPRKFDRNELSNTIIIKD